MEFQILDSPEEMRKTEEYHSTLLFDRLRLVKAKLKHEPFRGLPRVSAVQCGKTLQNYIFN